MDEVWLVCEADLDYNDNYHYVNAGGKALRAFSTEEAARDYTRNLMTTAWLPEDCEGDTNQERRLWWVDTYGTGKDSHDSMKGYRWDEIPVVNPEMLRDWCKANDQDPLDFLPAIYFLQKVQVDG